MEAVKEMIKVDIKNYDRFWEMLNSPDKENAVVAMSILNQADFRESLPYILLLLKDRDSNQRKEWFDTAPDLESKLKAINVDNSTSLTYKFIIDKVIGQCNPEAIQFAVDKFSVVLKNYVINWGFDFVKEMEFKLILKPKL